MVLKLSFHKRRARDLIVPRKVRRTRQRFGGKSQRRRKYALVNPPIVFPGRPEEANNPEGLAYFVCVCVCV